MSDDNKPQPNIVGGVPYCTIQCQHLLPQLGDDRVLRHTCQLDGCRPRLGETCLPAVREMAANIAELRNELRALVVYPAIGGAPGRCHCCRARWPYGEAERHEEGCLLR